MTATTAEPVATRHSPRAEPAGGNTLTGLRPLIRLALRRDRIWWPVWLLVVTAWVVSTAGAYDALYATPESRGALATTLGANPSLLAMYGPAFDLTSAGGFTAWRITAFAAAAVALMSLLTVIRHTRAEEEDGRLELLRSGVVGRHAPLAAALVTTVAADLVLGVIVAAGMVSEQTDTAGSVALGAGLAGVGIVFAGIAAVAAQLTEGSRSARGLAAAALGAAYLLRALGDGAQTTWLSWLSPIGWAQQLRPYAGERWWALGIPLVLALVLVVTAIVLESRRDVGTGLVAARLGPERAGGALRTPAALAWRLQRGSLVAWVVGVAIFAAAIGSVANGVLDLFEGNPQLEEMFRKMGGQQGLVDGFFAAVLPLIATLATIHSVGALLRLRSEENDLRAEQVLGTAVTRGRFAASHLVPALVGPVVLMVVAGLSAGGTYAATTHDAGQVWRVLGSALITVPAMWVLTGLTMALIGFAPRLTVLAWAALAVCGLLGQVGQLLSLPTAVLRASPYANLPKLPGVEVTWTPVVVLLAITAALVAAGLRGFRGRDIG